ncbi:MAG: LytR C-terminal domain-containing protein [Patescibacteria group bacterium]
MVFFRKPLVCFLASTYLEVFETNTHNQHHLPFPPELVRHAEIVNEKKFKEELQKFLEGLSLKKGKGIILLSKELVYVSDININNKNEEDETSKFTASLPLVRSNIATISLHNKNKIQILAANRKLYECVEEILKMNDIEIFSIAPVSVFDFRINDHELTPQDAKKIAGAKKKLRGYNFLQSRENPQIEDEDTDTKEEPEEEIGRKSTRKQYVFLALSVLLLAGTIGYLLLWSNTITNPWFKKPENLQTKPKAVTIPTITSQPSPAAKPTIEKSAIKIQILNGSGVEGQAGKLSNLLQEAGYSNVTTGNISDFEQRTTIMYKKLVPKDMLTDITDTIKNDFPDPTLQEASKSAEFDILITTGSF